MKLLKIVYFILLIFLSSCVTLKSGYKKDYYAITNLMINDAAKTRDSVYIIDWKSKQFYRDNNVSYDSSNFSILNFKRNGSKEKFSKLKEKFLRYNINIDYEIPYFKEQLKNPRNLNRQKITLKKLKIFPADSDWYSVKYNLNANNYYYVLSRPLITRNGLNAIYYVGGSDHTNFFIVLSKQNNNWEIVDKFNADNL